MKSLFKKKNLLSLYIIITIVILYTITGCNKTEGKENKVINKDQIKPVILLNGEKELTISPGDTYIDSGALATDNIDGDISSKLKVLITKDNITVEQINTSNAGEFLIKYNVTDSSGNSAEEIIKKVKVEKTNLVYINSKTANIRNKAGKNEKKIIMLSKGAELDIIGEIIDEENSVWLNVEYSDKSEKKSGWIKKEFTTDKKENLILEKYKNLDYSPIKKTQYPNNPKVKVKGIYLTTYSAGGKKLDELIELTKRTEINAFVIDVKDDDGHLLFPMKAGEKYAPKSNKKNMVKDISALMKKLKDNNIYTIARIVSFKDPTYTEAHPDRAIIYKNTGKPFTNSDNLTWATAYDRILWEYNIAVAKEAVAAGFNEIQFDYVRFPASSGGKLDSVLDYRNSKNETKTQVIQEYLKYARKELSPLGAYISADVYGLVASVEDDMALGQYWEAISNVVDYICPMMYPSHYGNGIYGLSIPDAFPYETVYYGTADAVKRNKIIKTPAIIRPWIQDFTAAWVKGHIKYGDKEVAEQIRALKENGVEEYLLWNATNRYSEGALRR